MLGDHRGAAMDGVYGVRNSPSLSSLRWQSQEPYLTVGNSTFFFTLEAMVGICSATDSHTSENRAQFVLGSLAAEKTRLAPQKLITMRVFACFFS